MEVKRLIQNPWSLAWLPLLYGLQSIPGTGALRTLFLACGITHLVLLGMHRRERATVTQTGGSKWLVTAFLVLTAWLAFHALVVARQPADAFAAWLAEWGKVILLAAIGVELIRLWPRPGEVTIALLAGAMLHVVGTLGYQATRLIFGQPLQWGMSWLGNYGYASPFVTTATALLLADLVARAQGHRLFAWANRWTVLLLLLALTAEVVLRAKAGQLMTALLFAVAMVLGTSRQPLRTRWLWLAVALCAIIVFLTTSQDRWASAYAELRAAVTRPPDAATLMGNAPIADTLPEGSDGSFFLRLTWARMALEGIRAHPEGLGYGGDAFGRWVEQRWGIPGAVSSHSGWLDFTLANGVVGAVLLLGFVCVLLDSAWRMWKTGHGEGLALFFVGLQFFLRGSIDGLFYGSRLAAAALAIGLLFALSHARRPD